MSNGEYTLHGTYEGIRNWVKDHETEPAASGVLGSIKPGDTFAVGAVYGPVNHPAHYTQGGVECIDAIRAALGREGFIAFLRGQVIKYQWRLGLKGSAAEDAAKARWYADRLVEVLNETE